MPPDDQAGDDRQETLPAIATPVNQDKRGAGIRTLGIVDLHNTSVKFFLF
jgi:hypothetical protein